MLIEHRGAQPRIDHSAYVAPNAVVSGDVVVGPETRILFGAVVTADGGPVRIGAHCIVMENAVIRGTPRQPASVGDHVLIGPRAYLSGCAVEDSVFLATGTTVFNGARIGSGAEVRINGVVHVHTVVAEDAVVPIGWVAVGNPAEILPPAEHDRIWSVQEALNFPGTVFGMDRAPGKEFMPDMTVRYTTALGSHREDRVL